MLAWYDGENTTKKRRRLGQMLVSLIVTGKGKGQLTDRVKMK